MHRKCIKIGFLECFSRDLRYFFLKRDEQTSPARTRANTGQIRSWLQEWCVYNTKLLATIELRIILYSNLVTNRGFASAMTEKWRKICGLQVEVAASPCWVLFSQGLHAAPA